MDNIIIAMDGPTASGKGTVARMLAQRLGFLCLDTGAIYRAITVWYLRNNPQDSAEFEEGLKNADIRIRCDENKKTVVYLDGDNITDEIRTVTVGKTTPTIAGDQIVQDKVRQLQYQIASENNLVVEGRETTSVAFPYAKFKFYLTASLDERAKRRMKEMHAKGENLTLKEVKALTAERDRLDMERKISPLIKVADAIEIDTTGRDVNEVVDEMVAIVTKS